MIKAFANCLGGYDYRGAATVKEVRNARYSKQ